MVTAHATCIAFDGRGVLLRGSPGSGKSDLALRAIADGARLVADDQVILSRRGSKVVASSPPTLYGMIEIRGLGIMRVEAEAEAELVLVVDLTDRLSIDRLPEPRRCELIGVDLPLLAMTALETSALAKLRFALLAACDPDRMAT